MTLLYRIPCRQVFHFIPFHRSNPQMTPQKNPAGIVGEVLEGYARKGIFRGFSPASNAGPRTTFRIVWHRDQRFECILDPKRRTLRVPVVLPDVPARSEMDRAFKEYVKDRHSESRPPHRRIDPAKTEIKPYNRANHATLTATVHDDDYEYAARKLVNLINEIYMDFLRDGRFYDYMIDTFNLDPDHP